MAHCVYAASSKFCFIDRLWDLREVAPNGRIRDRTGLIRGRLLPVVYLEELRKGIDNLNEDNHRSAQLLHLELTYSLHPTMRFAISGDW